MKSKHDGPVGEVMRHHKKFGLDKGLAVPIFDQSGFAGFVSASGPKPATSDRIKALFHPLALYGFHSVRSLRTAKSGGNSRLSQREREVLSWVASGKSAWEIGEILGIAKRTVDEQVHSACRKLDAANRSQAVAIAIRDRLIEL